MTRGAVLVAAVFDAFLQIYKRSAPTTCCGWPRSGTGVSCPTGDIPVDLVNRLAQEASKVAGQVLDICIRALDYCPPVDISLRRVSARADHRGHRARARGCTRLSHCLHRGVPRPRHLSGDVKHLSPASLVWEPPPLPLTKLQDVLKEMELGWDLNAKRDVAYHTSRENAKKMHAWLSKAVDDEQFEALGLTRKVGKMPLSGVDGELRRIEVHSVRPARRIGPDNEARADLVVEVTQSFRPAAGGRFRGGCTLIIDLEKSEVRYFVRKRVTSSDRFRKEQAFRAMLGDELRANYFGASHLGAEPFAMMHRSDE